VSRDVGITEQLAETMVAPLGAVKVIVRFWDQSGPTVSRADGIHAWRIFMERRE
jgi:hypothetical protein